MASRDNSDTSILVICGQASVRMNIVRHLRSAGYRVDAAQSARDAIRIDRESVSNVIVTDSQIPDARLLDMLRKISDNRRLMKDIVEMEAAPVILVAGGHERFDDNELSKFGVLARLRKPLNMQSLGKVVDQIVSGQLAVDESAKANIYIVDPEKRALDYFSRLLSADDVNLKLMSTAVELDVSLGEEPCDILLLETLAVTDDPAAFVESFKERSPHTTVFICSAMIDEALAERCRELGVTQVMTKPINPAELRTAIRQAVAAVKR